MKNLSMPTRALVATLVPLLVLGVTIDVYFIRLRTHEFEQVFVARSETLVRQLAAAAEAGLRTNDTDFLHTLTRAAAREADVVSAEIFDNRGRLASRTVATDLPAEVARAASVEFREPVLPSTKAPASAVGSVTVVVSKHATDRWLAQVTREIVLATLFALSLTVFLAWRLGRAFAAPVLQLARAVEGIRHGKFEVPGFTKLGGELAVLGQGLHAMAERWRSTRQRDKQHADNALYLERMRAQVTLESIGDGVITTDEHARVVYLNSVAEQFTGWDRQSAQGQNLSEVFRVFDETQDEVGVYPIDQVLTHGRSLRHDAHHEIVRRDGARVGIQDTAAPIRDRDGTILGAVVVFRDVSEIQHMARRMAYLASHDPLTGLINRREFENRLQAMLTRANERGEWHAVCYLDLDEFKVINDTTGHVAGDELLKQLAHHLSREVRAADVLARLGGDEFGVIFEHVTLDKARQLAELLLAAVREFRFVWQGNSFQLGASIGVVPVTRDSGTLTEILSAADSACYVAKDQGRHRIHVTKPDDSALAQRQGEMEWVQRLRQGLEQNHFELYAQAIVPINAASARQSRFYEILVRVHDQDLVLPTVFLPAAERYHLMPAIDRWVVHASLSLLQRYYTSAASRGTDARFSINLSGQSLSDEAFLDYVVSMFGRTGVDPRHLCFEITETAAIANLVRARHFIARLKSMGCQFALDDFGSGLSSFGYLKSLPVDYLKIAGDFVQDIVEDPVDHAMVDAIAQIGHVMGLSTVAESVENQAILNKLKELGIDYGQGLGLGSPRPLHQVLSLPLEDWQTVRDRSRAESVQ